MKKIILFALSCLTLSLSAQLTVEQDTVYTPVEDVFEVIGKNTFTNGIPQLKTYRWVITNVSNDPNWDRAMCDQNQCYLPSVDSMEIQLPPNASSLLDLHVYPAGNAEGSALFEVVVKDVASASNSVTVMYIFDSQLVDTYDPQTLNFRVFPNPSEGLFSIGNTEGRAELLEVYSTTGQLLLTYDVRANNWYDLAKLQSGNYLVRLSDHEGRTLGTKLITKL